MIKTTKTKREAVAGAEPLPAVLVEGDDRAPPLVIEKDELGRFVTGNSGGGRPLGSRNKLTETFLEDCYTLWREGGIEAMRKVMKNEPIAFVRTIAGLMPRDVLLEARGAGLIVVRMTDEDLAL